MLRFVSLFLLAVSAAVSVAIPPRVPPLVQTENAPRLPGKIVWADVLSTEPNTTSRFYAALLDWTPRTLADDTGKYIVLSTPTGPVAGVGRGPDRKDQRPASRWVCYFSTSSLSAAEAAIASAGGAVLAGPMPVPRRGSQLVAVDAQGALFGLIASTSGDPADGPTPQGALFWANLFSPAPAAAAPFYETVAGLSDRPAAGSSRLLSTRGVDRASISPLDDDTSVTPTWVPYFRVGSLEQKLKLAKRLGAKLVIAPRTFSNGARVAVLADPLGGVFALAQRDPQ